MNNEKASEWPCRNDAQIRLILPSWMLQKLTEIAAEKQISRLELIRQCHLENIKKDRKGLFR